MKISSAVNIISHLGSKSKVFVRVLGFALVELVGFADFLTGYEIVLSGFYILPISMITWYEGVPMGTLASLASIITWFWADFLAGSHPSNLFIPVWNFTIRFILFFVITLLLAELRKRIEREKVLARTDYLTGAANRRSFSEMLQIEIDRSRRLGNPVSLAYIDLDNFKSINDTLGHSVGDQVLRSVVNCIRRNVRKIDTVARLSGDEFALLLPGANQESSRFILRRLQSLLLEEMRQNEWPVTFSVGVVTCSNAFPDTNELLSIADQLMYSVKRTRKNAIAYAAYDSPAHSASDRNWPMAAPVASGCSR